MDDYKIIVEQEHQTVMAHYEVGAKPDGGYFFVTENKNLSQEGIAFKGQTVV